MRFNIQRLVRPALALGICVFAALPAKAGIYLEPYLGYAFGTAESTATGGATSKSLLSGPMIGARVAYSLPIFFAGLDYSMMTGGKSKADSGSAVDGDLSGYGLFAVAGARLPLIRAYAGYGFLNSWETKTSSATSTTTGTAIKLGAGFSGLPFVCINLEYILSTFNKIKTSAGEFSLGDAGIDKITSSTYMLNVSLPLDF